VAAGIIVDVFSPPDFSGAPLYSAAPMAAAALLSFRGTLLTGLAAIAADTGQLAALGYLSTVGNYTEPATIATVTAVALVTNGMLRRSDRRARSARTVAAAVQRAVLPHPATRIDGLQVAVRYQAAFADARIGGDLYAAQLTPFGVRCLVGDVRGKGLEAVEAVTVVLGAFREAADEEPTLLRLAGRLERALLREGRRRAGLDQVEGFTTALLAELAPPEDGASVRTLRLVNCGHPAPLLLTPGTPESPGSAHVLEPSSPALPLGTALDADGPVEDSVPLPAGATLLLFTDGVTEARDASDVFYEPAERLPQLPFTSPGQLLDALIADVTRHTGGSITDDMALLALTPPAATSPRR
jgi:serine phosphatase RsbU (regulator of sigma subunit)